MNTQELESGEYYLINGNKVLYWNGYVWLKPVKNSMGQYCGVLQALAKQPAIIKTIEKTNEPRT